MLRGRVIPLLLCGVALALPAPSGGKEPPLGLAKPPPPEDAAREAARAALGKKLFFEPKLGADGKVSCATCHIPTEAFAQKGKRVSEGVDGRLGRRNSPSLFNVVFAESLFLDGRAASLEEQAWMPLLDEQEMANRSVEEVLARLEKSEDYEAMFDAAFDSKTPSKAHVAAALASFQRTLLSGNSRFDRWLWGGEDGTLTEQEIDGYELFDGQALCWQCHPIGGDGIQFTDHEFHNTGVAKRSASKAGIRLEDSGDLGRFEVTKKPADRFRFKTPSLRNIALTAPYMHDGSFATLREVVEFYNEGGGHAIQQLDFDDEQLDALVAFLKTLDGDQPGR